MEGLIWADFEVSMLYSMSASKYSIVLVRISNTYLLDKICHMFIFKMIQLYGRKYRVSEPSIKYDYILEIPL